MHTISAAVEDVGADHGGPYFDMSRKLRDGSDIVIIFEQMGGERVAKRMTAGMFVAVRFSYGCYDRLGEHWQVNHNDGQ